MGAQSADVAAALVRDFEEGADRIHSKDYKEANVRQDFIDPLFGALGWNTADSREVQHERAVRIKEETKSVDIAFRLPNRLAFVLEAKRPTAKIAGNADFAFQARRYGWNASVPFAILSNFGETVVYDTTIRPKHSDSANVAFAGSWSAQDLVKKWPDFEGRFGKAAVVGGALERWSAKVPGKQARISVDESLLEDIGAWRLKLAKNIIARNDLEPHQLAEVVQLLLDRILFLRICEDRGLETPRRLEGLMDAGKIYDRLKRLLELADQKYNAGLFYLEEERGRGPADTVSASLRVDDDVLREVIGGLYNKNRPYNFAIIPTEILGQVYEQFLGTVLRVTASGDRVKPDFKPEVKEAGGVFYTPAYIVERIVRSTVAPLLEGKSPAEVAALRILDPACGSGSFLLGAYQFLLSWHHDWYAKDGPKKHPLELVEVGKGQWILSVDERKRILRNNIYGVDIDRQATEVTKLSLFLKVVEETAGRALDSNQKLFEDRVLPSMERNIKCGNALIEPSQVPQQSFDGEEMQTARRVNAFSWRQTFESIMARGGFDAIIGNPPYIRVQALNQFAPLEVELYKKHFTSASRGNYDIYVTFVERGLQLLNESGRLGYIVPHKFFKMQYGEPLRHLLASGRHLDSIVSFGDQQVFAGATTYTCLLTLTKAGADEFRFQSVRDLDEWRASEAESGTVLPSTAATEAEWRFGTTAFASTSDASRFKPLVEVVPKIFQGIATSLDSVYVMTFQGQRGDLTLAKSKALDQEVVEIETAILHPLLKGAEISRYVEPTNEFVILFPYDVVGDDAIPIPEKELKRRFPRAYDYLLRNKKLLLDRSKTDNSNWWFFPYPKNLALYNRPKILVQVLAQRGNFTWDPGRIFFVGGGTAGGNALLVHDERQAMFLLGILNSPLTTRHVSQVGSGFRGGFFAFGKGSLASFPIPIIDESKQPAVEARDRLVTLVRAILRLHRERDSATTASDRELIQRQIDNTDADINEVVYGLYNLTAEERAVAEGENVPE